IAAYEFDPVMGNLTIYFVSGYTYVYFAVDEKIVKAMAKAPSVGVYFTKNIKNNYAFKKLNKSLQGR
ncbi:MAG: KTSC domain-containing protein, partial [Nanoarchaeota archaeon]